MSEEKKKEVAVVPKPVAMDAGGVVLSDMGDAWRFSLAIIESGANPKGVNTPAQVFALVQAGAEFGLGPMASLSNMANINGRVGPMGKMAKAKVLSSGMVDGIISDEMYGKYGEMDYGCRVTSRRKDGKGVLQVSEFTVEDAKRAGLWGKSGPWSSYPKQMLYYRALGFHLDRFYPDAMAGFVIAESLGDYPTDTRSTVLTPLDKPENDPILDLVGPGDIQEQLEALEVEIAAEGPAERDPGARNVYACGHDTEKPRDDCEVCNDARMYFDKQEEILKRLEANDAPEEPVDTNNSQPEGADEQPDLL